jgi:3-hydroxy-9,10-secoandrosta-1,3,5(10)-triene-9,17-dione monooxygenase
MGGGLTQTAVSGTEPLTDEQLIENARSLIPVVRERRAIGDAERKLPEETLEDFKRLGIVRSLTPKRFGGMEVDLETAHTVAMEVARGDGASGWLASFFPIHQFYCSWLPLEFQEEYWADGPDALSSTCAGFAFQREEVKDGLRFSGRGKFSSGVDYAQWLILTTSHELAMIPRSDFQIVDDWYVAGLRGTGSQGLILDNVFVPRHRTVSVRELEDPDTTGARYHSSPWYHLQRFFMLSHAIVFPVLGMAKGVLDIFDERVRGRVDPQTGKAATDSPGPALRFAESVGDLRAAETLLRGNMTRMRESALTGNPLSQEERAELRLNIVYAAKLLLQSTNRLVDGMDSSAVYDVNVLHRQATDTRTGALQLVLQWEETAIQYSRVHWGFEPHTILY